VKICSYLCFLNIFDHCSTLQHLFRKKSIFFFDFLTNTFWLNTSCLGTHLRVQFRLITIYCWKETHILICLHFSFHCLLFVLTFHVLKTVNGRRFISICVAIIPGKCLPGRFDIKKKPGNDHSFSRRYTLWVNWNGRKAIYHVFLIHWKISLSLNGWLHFKIENRLIIVQMYVWNWRSDFAVRLAMPPLSYW